MKDLSNEQVVHIKDRDIEYLQFRKLLEYENVIKHAYGLKPANYMTKRDRVTDEVFRESVNNYKKLCNSIGLDYNRLVKPSQMHTNEVKVVEVLENEISLESEKYANTDGLVTDKKQVILASTNADCIVLMFFDPIKKVIGNVHSGWKGTFQKIAVNAVNKMIEEYSSNPKDIICCICPSIRKCHFEVEKEVKDMCEEIFSYTNQIDRIIEYAGKKDGVDKWVIDTVLINKIILEDCGLEPQNIIDSGICSVCNCDMVHSYRVEGKEYGLCSAIISM